MKTVKLYLDADEPAIDVKVRRLTPKNVIALGQFGRQLMGAGVGRSEIEGLFQGGELKLLELLELVWVKLADPEAEIGKESRLETSFYLLLQTITGLSAEMARMMTFEDICIYAEAIMQQEASSRVGGLLRPMISSISPLLLDLFTPSSLPQSGGENPPAESGTAPESGPSVEAGSIPGGGMSNGGLTPSLVPLSTEQDGPSITSSMASPSERPSNLEPALPVLT